MQKAGKYEILRKVGAGGFGVVYEGRDPFIKRRVAIKTCTSDEEDIRARFYREAEIAGNLQHKNIVTIHDFGVEEGVPYLVQEYLPGEDLLQVISRRDELGLARKLDILLQVAHGMAFAHSRGVIHRDIKPANIRLLEDGRVKIMDFGIAKLADVESRLTKEGMTVGTAAYLPPEQIRGEKVDTRADIFSYGVLAYELLALRRPFDGASLSTLLYQILSQQPRPLIEVWPEAPPRVAALVVRCLEKEVARRCSSFDEVEAELELALADAEKIDDTQNIPHWSAASEGQAALAEIGERTRLALAAGDLTAAELELVAAEKEWGAEISFREVIEPLRGEVAQARDRQAEEGRRNETVRRDLDRGRAELDRREFTEAHALFAAALALDPQNAEASAGLAQADAGLADQAAEWERAAGAEREAQQLRQQEAAARERAAQVERQAEARRRQESERQALVARQDEEHRQAEARHRAEVEARTRAERERLAVAKVEALLDRGALEKAGKTLARLETEIGAPAFEALGERLAAARQAESQAEEQQQELRRLAAAELARQRQEEAGQAAAAVRERDEQRQQATAEKAIEKANRARARSLEATAGSKITSGSFSSPADSHPRAMRWIALAATGLVAAVALVWLLGRGESPGSNSASRGGPAGVTERDAAAAAGSPATESPEPPVAPASAPNADPLPAEVEPKRVTVANGPVPGSTLAPAELSPVERALGDKRQRAEVAESAAAEESRRTAAAPSQEASRVAVIETVRPPTTSAPPPPTVQAAASPPTGTGFLSSTPPATAAVVPMPAATKPEPAAVRDERAAVEEALRGYRSAYESLDTKAVRAIWPAIDEASLRQIARAFSGYKAISMQIERCQIAIDSSSATARCQVTQRIDVKVGSDIRSAQSLRFELSKSKQRWVIVSRTAE